MKYYYLKFGKSNYQLDYWLQLNRNENIFGKPTAVIFFGEINSEEFKEYFKKYKEEYKLLVKEAKKNKKYLPSYTDLHNQIEPFYEAGEKQNARYIAILESKIYVLAPKSEVRDVSSEELEKIINDLNGFKKPTDAKDFSNDILKVMDLEILKIIDINIPYILRTLGTDQYLNRGTFREIKEENHWGSIQAIKMVLGERNEVPEKIDHVQLFKLLSPHQFETLIFLLLTNKGLFSPAWRGGTLPDIDIIGINYSNKDEIKIGDPSIIFRKNEEITFQVKRKPVTKKQKAHHTITLAYSSKKLEFPEFLTVEWVFKAVMEQQKTKEWLENSLRWFIEDTEYSSIFQIVTQ